MTSQHTTGTLIVGAGLAGLSLALRLANHMPVTLLAKKELTEGASLYAQGGIAAVLAEDDSCIAHCQDTLNAGAGLCRPDVVEHVITQGPRAIRWLEDQGVQFSPAHSGLAGHHLTQEGGHSHRRVVHAQDATGRMISTTLEAQVRSHPQISVLEHHIAIDLITNERLQPHQARRCLGLYALDKQTGNIISLSANTVVLATGGASKAYLYTSNPDTSTGDGIAMAWRAGCRVANMEFVQFHPTCVYHPEAKSFLISEAVRGEGGKLVLPNGSAFMHHHDPREELAPRDIVARAIDYEMKKGGYDSIFLDISHKPAESIKSAFPTIYERCLDFGFDMTRQAIPVVPAAHYSCGGVVTDMSGRCDLPGLYTIGESACTGLHGANRLASNSLLECLVFAESAADDILRQGPLKTTRPELSIPAWDASRVVDPDEQIVVSHNWNELRHFMWDYVGIVRTNKRLERAARRAQLLSAEIQDYYSSFIIHNDLIELRNLLVIADLTIQSARLRQESRGLHYTLDYPQTDSQHPPQDTVLTPASPIDSSWRTNA